MGRRARVVPVALLASGFAVGAWVNPEFRGDSVSYFTYLRSAVFDRDLDFANEWEHWGYPELPKTETGLRRNVHSIGPALVWSPFYLGAHVYVSSGAGAVDYAADGYTFPYRRAAAAGTIAAVLGGALLLAQAIRSRLGPTMAAWTVGALCLASPVAYYTFVVPTMAHGAAFAAMSGLVWSWHRVETRPSRAGWLEVGAWIGAVTLMRWQAVTAVLLVAPLALQQLRRREVRWTWLLAGAGVALLVFSPQLVVWHQLYGRWVTLPQGSSFVDWSSPHLWDTLISANHGLFTWTPVLLLGALGLLFGLRRSPLFAVGALLVLAATAWVNGGVADWTAGDAFGARRFDLVFPLLGVGLGWLLAESVRLLSRHPLLAPAALLTALALWNLSFVSIFRRGDYAETAPLDRLARDQVRQAGGAAGGVFGGLFGAEGRALAYKVFSAEYFYTSFNRGGTILPAAATADERYLLRGWATRGRQAGRPDFRWALHPEACVRIPLDRPFEMSVAIEAFAPEKAQPQTLTLLVNGTIVGAAPLNPEWTEPAFVVPESRLVGGENELCLRFTGALPGEPGQRVAAGIGRIQLP